MKYLALVLMSVFLFSNRVDAKTISCRKYSGNHNKWTLDIFFNKKGKMIVQASAKGSGWTSRPGSYIFKKNLLKVFIHSRQRLFEVIKKSQIIGTPYSFDIGDDFKTKVILRRDKSYICK